MKLEDFTFKAQRVEVIITGLEGRGAGDAASPLRRVYQIWSLDGELLAEVDPHG